MDSLEKITINKTAINKIAIQETQNICLKLEAVNQNNIIEVVIENNIPYISKPTTTELFICRQTEVLRFLQDFCVQYPILESKKFPILLDDCTYNDLGVMVFSKPHSIQQNIMIPDIYAMCRYNGKIDITQNEIRPKYSKKAIFIGCTTGIETPNQRLECCHWSMNNIQVDAYINNIVQMHEEDVKRQYPLYKHFMRDAMDIEKQLQYQYVINIDGNTCSWDRLVWILNSGSVCLKKKSTNCCWYNVFLQKNVHYIEFDSFDEIPAILENTTRETIAYIVENANRAVKEYLIYDAHLFYFHSILMNL